LYLNILEMKRLFLRKAAGAATVAAGIHSLQKLYCSKKRNIFQTPIVNCPTTLRESLKTETVFFCKCPHLSDGLQIYLTAIAPNAIY